MKILNRHFYILKRRDYTECQKVINEFQYNLLHIYRINSIL